MSTRKTTAERIEAAKAEKAQVEAEIKELMQKHREEERNKRNHRISTRGAHMEKLLPDTIGLSDARFFTFLERPVANDFGRRALAALKAEQDKEDAANRAADVADGSDTPVEPSTVTTAQDGKAPAPKPAAPPINGGETHSAKPAQTAATPAGAGAGRTVDSSTAQGA